MSVEPSSSGPQQAALWDHTNRAGTEGCPPRCPRFHDTLGTALLVRPYDDEQFETLVNFYDAYPHRHRSLSLPPLTRPQIESWLERLLERGKNLLAFDDERLVGHVGYTPSDGPEAELVVFVDEAYQNRGIGTELCQQATAYGAEDELNSLKLDVDTANERAIHVYRSLGFHEVEQNGASVVMQLTLDDELTERVQVPPAERL